MNNSDIEAVVAKLKSAPVSKRLGERFYISEELFRIAENAKKRHLKHEHSTNYGDLLAANHSKANTAAVNVLRMERRFR